MQTAVQSTFSNTHINTATQPSVFSKFMSWCTAHDKRRYGWLGIVLMAHGSVFTPITLFAIVMSGNSIVLWILAIIAMMTLITNLAALPIKYTLPVFFLSILIDAALIITCASMGFNISGTYE